jgi:hypothetical protein
LLALYLSSRLSKILFLTGKYQINAKASISKLLLNNQSGLLLSQQQLIVKRLTITIKAIATEGTTIPMMNLFVLVLFKIKK